MTVDGSVYSQSDAIARYCARRAGLYPRNDDMLACAIDEVLGAVADFVFDLMQLYDPFEQNPGSSAVGNVHRAIEKYLSGLENIVRTKATHETWLCGEGMSLADIEVYCLLAHFKHDFVTWVDSNIVDKYSRLIASYEAVAKHPKVVQWNERYPWTNQCKQEL